jgi:hypothetical protein
MGGIAEGSFIPSWAGEAGGRQKDSVSMRKGAVFGLKSRFFGLKRAKIGAL